MALCGDFIVVPTDLDVTARNPKTAPARRRQLGWIDDASFNEQERWAVSLKEALPRMIAGELSRNAKTIATGKMGTIAKFDPIKLSASYRMLIPRASPCPLAGQLPMKYG
jgi:hypothetical protein